MKPSTLLRTTALLLAATSCEQPPAPTSPVVLLDSIVLDTDAPGAAVDRPNRIYRSSSGGYYVVDFATQSVLEFSGRGAFVRQIGREGKGPGEFTSPGMVATLDTTILVIDPVQHTAQRFNQAGAYLDSPFLAPFISNGIAVDDRFVWVTGVSPETPWTVLKWNRADGATEWAMQKPQAWVDYPILGALGGSHVAFGSNATFMTFGGVDQVVRWGPDLAAPPDTFPIPRRIRRGVPVDKVKAGEFRGLSQLFGMSSGVGDLSVLPSGGVAVLYVDLTINATGRSARYYLTTLDSAGAPECVDVELPTPPDTRPAEHLSADTLIILEQEVTDAGEVRNVVRRWLTQSGPHVRCPG